MNQRVFGVECAVSEVSTATTFAYQVTWSVQKKLARIKQRDIEREGERIRVSNTQAEVKGQRDLADVNGAQPPRHAGATTEFTTEDDPFYLPLAPFSRH